MNELQRPQIGSYLTWNNMFAVATISIHILRYLLEVTELL